nr:hypothetical protein Iba_chr03bCG12650 [Ipomoea batatas]
MPPKSSQVLADTPTKFSSATHFTSSVSKKVQSTGGISSKVFQDTPSNFRSVGHLTSSVVTKGEHNKLSCSMAIAFTKPYYRMRSNEKIHPARNLEEEFSATLQDTSKVRQENGVVGGSVQHEENNVPKCIPTINGVEPTCPLPSTSLECIPDVYNVQSVAPPINTNVQTSSGVDINNTIVIPPEPDGT